VTARGTRTALVARRRLPALVAFVVAPVATAGLASVGCVGTTVSDPHEAAAAFAAAASRGDSEAVYAMLSPSAARALSREDVKRLVADEAEELKAEGRALGSPDARAVAVARLRFADGEQVALEWSGGRFGMSSGGAMPGGAPTPEAALDELRRAIARRSYPALLRLLSPATRSAVEQDLRTLVGGLEHPESLPIHTSGDAANAVVPGGHHVTLKRDGSVWRVEDFD
jgi:hypothetical protein